jgi:hypothetical protein
MFWKLKDFLGPNNLMIRYFFLPWYFNWTEYNSKDGCC